jgi:hypothetical protein
VAPGFSAQEEAPGRGLNPRPGVLSFRCPSRSARPASAPGIDKDPPGLHLPTPASRPHLRDPWRSDSLRWFWSMTVNGPMTRSDRVATLEEAKAQFQKSWDEWKAWAKLEEVP